jgi:BirA family biotin operon repressor/biotin-[acetyl-CoA-carboxylase] ligase
MPRWMFLLHFLFRFRLWRGATPWHSFVAWWHPVGMDFPRSRAVSDLTVVAESASTNDDLLARAAESAEFTVHMTTSQTAGRGRLGRVWVAPPGQTLAASVLLKPRLANGRPLPLDRFGWLPLLAGLAMTRAVRAVLPGTRVALKWPNDVQVEGKKVAGLLAELLPAADGVVIGSGVNLAIPAADLPTPVSTSIGLHDVVGGAGGGAGVRASAGQDSASEVHDSSGTPLAGDELIDAVLGGYLEEMHRLYSAYLSADGDAAASGLHKAVTESCSTLGQSVRVELPGGSNLLGTATGLDSDGRLLVTPANGPVQAVAAGDVTHLRYE